MLVIAALAAWLLFNRPDQLPSRVLAVAGSKDTIMKVGQVGGACPSQRCLTIYVAPWCPSCRAMEPTINALGHQLEAEGMTVRLVVGSDTMSAVREYARKFDRRVLLDPDGAYFNESGLRGVPYFAVTDADGRILEARYGGRTTVAGMREFLDL
ncbi:MAG: TlpA disulfide reductase family protein [Pseudomonadota bacterium]